MQLAGASLQTSDWGLVEFRHCASLERLSQGQEIATPPGANQWRGKCSDFKQRIEQWKFITRWWKNQNVLSTKS